MKKYYLHFSNFVRRMHPIYSFLHPWLGLTGCCQMRIRKKNIQKWEKIIYFNALSLQFIRGPTQRSRCAKWRNSRASTPFCYLPHFSPCKTSTYYLYSLWSLYLHSVHYSSSFVVFSLWLLPYCNCQLVFYAAAKISSAQTVLVRAHKLGKNTQRKSKPNHICFFVCFLFVCRIPAIICPSPQDSESTKKRKDKNRKINSFEHSLNSF